MLRSITAVQFQDWVRYASLEPFGELRADYRMANSMALLANIHRDDKKKPEPFAVEEFLFDFDGTARERREQQKQQSPEYITRVIEGWILVNNVSRGEKA